MKNPEEVRAAFENAKAAQAPLIVGAPSPEVMDATEAAVKEFNIPLAVHNHGPRTSTTLAARGDGGDQKRDKRLGVCMDVGHTVRAGVDPVKAVPSAARGCSTCTERT